MSTQQCIAAVNAAAGRELSPEEMDGLITELRARRTELLRTGAATDPIAAGLKAAELYANELRTTAVVAKRNAALDIAKRTERTAWAQATFGTKISEAIETILVGTNRAVQGARDGVAQVQAAIRKHYAQGFITDLVKSDLHGIVASGALDRDIARAWFAIGTDDEAKVHAGLQKEAVEAAKIAHKAAEFARLELNKEGAWIKADPGAAPYLLRFSHDPYRITKAGKDAWIEQAKTSFDIPAMLAKSGDKDADTMLGRLYAEYASGVHLRVDKDAAAVSGILAPTNVASRVSKSDAIVWKDADAWFDYNQQFGHRNLRDSLVAGLNHAADATGLMRMLGTKPTETIARIKDQLTRDAQAAGDIAQLQKAKNDEAKLGNYAAAVDGSMNQPGNAIQAKVGATIRGIQSMAKLGSMIFSQLNDLAIYASAMKIQGRGYLSSMAEAISGLGTSLKQKERFELLSSLDVAMESMTGELGRTGSFNDPGSFAKAQAMFMKLNLGTVWTERLKGAALQGMSHFMALQKGKEFSALHPDYQRTLSIYGIGEKEWNAIRSVAAKELDGREYITPELMRGLPDGAALENKLRQYFTDRVGFAVIEPDVKTRAILLQGSKPGTPMGEFMRFLMQFKSFTGAYMQKSLGQELYGRGYAGDSLIGALRNGNGEWQGLARLIGISTIMGYASLTFKDLAKNRSQRDVTDPQIAWKTFLASMLQGGGAGIYGDFLFGEASRYGSGLMSTIAGPGISTITDMADLVHKAERGDMKAESLAANALRLGIQNTPYINLFYSKMALDYFILNDVYDSLSPGYMRRMERRMEKDLGQQFLIRPR